MPIETTDTPSAKASQVLDGALAAFMELGFDGASVDEIARRARVSKPTLYNHFADKRALFIAVVRRECTQVSSRIFTVDLSAGDIQAQLRTIGRRFLEMTLSDFLLKLFRLIVAESGRSPELGRVFYAAGPDLGNRRLAVLLAAAVGRGELQIDNVDLAAAQFIELCRADCFYHRLFRVVETVPEAEAMRVVDAAVATFMRAYRAPAA